MRKSIAVAAGLLLVAMQAHAAPSIGNLKSYTPATSSTCGLFLKNSHGELAFYADTSLDGYLSVDGTVTKVHHVKTENHQMQPGRVQSGDTFTSVFATEGTQVTLQMKVSKGCEGIGNVCQAVTETGTLKLQNSEGNADTPVTGGEHCANRN